MTDDDEDFLSPSLEASLDELKSIYTVLVEGQEAHPELVSNTFFQSLEELLEAQAHAEGVDLDDDGAWFTWLHDIAIEEPVETPQELLN